MPVEAQRLKHRYQTAKNMYRMSKNHWSDLDDYGMLDVPLNEVFTTVKNIPYEEDLENEVIARPGFLLDEELFPALDCKKKGVIMGAFLEAHGEPWRFVASSEKEDGGIHHVFPQVNIDGEWYNVDATYPDFNLYEPKPETTAAEELLY